MALRDDLNNPNDSQLVSLLQALGFGDLINIVMAAQEGSAAAITAATVTTPNAATQTASYVEADVQTIATLANALKTAVNALVADVTNLRAAVVAAGGYTETGVTVTSNVATLANTPSFLYVAAIATGTTTGVKKLLKGPVSGPNVVTPPPGSATWDGGKKVLFASADAASTANFLYATAADTTASLLQRRLTEQD